MTLQKQTQNGHATRDPQNLFEVINCLANHPYLLRLLLVTLQCYPTRLGLKSITLVAVARAIFATRYSREPIARSFAIQIS